MRLGRSRGKNDAVVNRFITMGNVSNHQETGGIIRRESFKLKAWEPAADHFLRYGISRLVGIQAEQQVYDPARLCGIS